MALIDAQLHFSSSQTLAAGGTSTNVVDNVVAANIFEGEPLAIVIHAVEGVDSALTVTLETDDNAAFSSPTAIGASTFPAADLTTGKSVSFSPPTTAAAQRYLRLTYTGGGTTTLSAYLHPAYMINTTTLYNDAITIG